MQNYQIVEIPPTFWIEIVPPLGCLNLSDAVLQIVESIWQKESKKFGPHLFNGKILSLSSLHKDKLVGSFIDYKYYFAQLRDPQLYEEINCCPIGTTGITTVASQYLIGQRALNVAAFPMAYEFAPSGGIDPLCQKGSRLDFCDHLIIELQEETGIPPTAIQKVTPKVLIMDTEQKSIELCGCIQLYPEAMQCLLHHEWEYHTLSWIKKNDLQTFLDKHRNECVPIAATILDYLLRKDFR